MTKNEAVEWCIKYLAKWPLKTDNDLKSLSRPLGWNWSHDPVTKNVILFCDDVWIFEYDIWGDVWIDDHSPQKEMTKYQPNSYHLCLFGELGSKIKTIVHVSFGNAEDEGKAHKEKYGGSYSILHVLKNSEIAHDIHDYEQWKKRMGGK